jgi:putative addiction module component (TIGR02574 family)
MAEMDVLADILRLPPEERARLAIELIRSLDGQADPDAAQAWEAEIERRGDGSDDDPRRVSRARPRAPGRA